MSNIIWGPNWGGTRLHAITDKPSGLLMNRQIAPCCAEAYPEPPTEYCAERVRAGIPRCKICERAIKKQQAAEGVE